MFCGNVIIYSIFMVHGKNCKMMYSSLNIVRVVNQGGRGGQDMWHAWGRGEVFTGFWLGGPNGRDHWEDLGICGRITLRWTLGR
jgi:hypothetical protein